MTNSDDNSSTTRALHIPELLDTIGSYLDPPELLPCVQVSQHWNQLFIPLLWRTINDQLYAWPRILKELDMSTTTNTTTTQPDDDRRAEIEDWVRSVFVKYGHHIQHLFANGFITIVSAQAAGTCTNLRTLAVIGFSKQTFQEAQALMVRLLGDFDSTEVEVQEVLSKALVSPVFKEVVLPPREQEDLRKEKWWKKWIFTQRFWLLVLQNPQLHGLRLDRDFMNMCVDVKQGYILETLASLANLTKLDIFFYGQSLTLEMVLEQVPQVCHFSSRFRNLLVPIHFKTFPQIRTLHCSDCLELPQLLSLLKSLPNLDQLWIAGFNPLTSATGEMSNSLSTVTAAFTATVSRLRGLHLIGESLQTAEEMDGPLADMVLPRLPCLTALSARALYPRMAASLGTHCPELQSFRQVDYGYSIHIDDGDQPLFNGVATLLRRCPNLKTLDVIWHKITAADVLAEPWVCRGLETLRCQIVGMDKLGAIEQDVYDSSTVATAAATAVEADRDDKEKDEPIKNLDIAKTTETRRKQQLRYKLHGQVYDRLAEMTLLRALDLGHEFRYPFDELFVAAGEATVYEVSGRMYTTLSPPISGTLELTLASGLSRLSALKNLEVFGFEGVDHLIETEEVAWMAENWPKLRILRGLQEPAEYRRLDGDVKTRMLREYMEKLRPFVKHEAVDEFNEMSYRNNKRLQFTF
ncbi:hypothetical protein BGW39_010110 [Mortierella sp. 14UC]|nr:hypothetical protein BGW39_010110 [Mortierella sp. 14UC]